MKRHINYNLLILSAILIISGLLFLSTLSAVRSLKLFGNTNYYLFNQLISIAIGLVAGFIFLKIPLNFLKKYAVILLVFNVLALLAVLIPGLGVKTNGASRWISIRGIGFQPSEFFKITIVVYISAWLSEKLSGQSKRGLRFLLERNYYCFTKVFLPFLVFLAITAGIFYLQKDISTLGIIAVTLIAIYFAAQTPIWHTALLFMGGVSGLMFLIIKEPYRLQRLLAFLNPEADIMGIGMQSNQALIALGSGGIFGKGLGMSIQKFSFLPESMTDSIFAIVGEELGIIGCAVLVVLFILFLWQGIKIAKSATDTFSKLTAVGIGTWITFQAFINMTAAIGIFPLAGIPLPFFSYGGSHIVAEMMGIGLLLNISKNG